MPGRAQVCESLAQRNTRQPAAERTCSLTCSGCSRRSLLFCFRCQPSDYELKSKKKGALRFWTPFIKDQLKRLASAEEQLVDAQRDQVRRFVWSTVHMAEVSAGYALAELVQSNAPASLLWYILRARAVMEVFAVLSVHISAVGVTHVYRTLARCERCSPSSTSTGSYGRVPCGAWRTWTPCCR